VVLTIPKRLRVHTRFDRTLPGKLCAAAWRCILAEVRRLVGRDDGGIAAYTDRVYVYDKSTPRTVPALVERGRLAGMIAQEASSEMKGSAIF
jgi:hypothetical protein